MVAELLISWCWYGALTVTRSGVFIHIEVQNFEQGAFGRRKYIYNYRMLDKYDEQIVSLAVLTDDSESWRPNSYRSSLWGCSLKFTFPVVKLLAYRSQIAALEASRNLFAIVTLAHLADPARLRAHQRCGVARRTAPHPRRAVAIRSIIGVMLCNDQRCSTARGRAKRGM